MESLYELLFRSIGPIMLVMAITLYNTQKDSTDNLQIKVKEAMQENDGVYSQGDGGYDKITYNRDYLIGMIAGGFTQTVEINMQASTNRSRLIFTPVSDGSVMMRYYEGTGAAEVLRDSCAYRPGSGSEGYGFDCVIGGVYELDDSNGEYVYRWVSN